VSTFHAILHWTVDTEKMTFTCIWVHLSSPELQSMAHAENFHRGVFHSVAYGGHLHLVCAFCDVTIWRNRHILLHALLLFMCHCTEYKLSALQVRISQENKLNAATQQFITAKISGCVLKQGSKTNSSLRQSSLQLQNEAALMSCQIRAIEHRKCAAGLAGEHPGLQDRILLDYTRIENADKVRKKTFNFLLCIEVQQTFSFPFPLLRHYQMSECFYVKNCGFWARATVVSYYKNGSSQCGQRLRWSALADKIKTIVSDKVNRRGTLS